MQVSDSLVNDITNVLTEAIGDYPSINEAIKGLKELAEAEKQRLLSIGFTPLEARLEQNKILAAVDALEELKIADAPPGKMYEVDILADKSKFLDYDTPLADQPKYVQNAYKKVFWDNFIEPDPTLRQLYESPEKLTMQDMRLFDNSRGSQAYNTLASELGAEKASKALSDAGIPAIKYTADRSRHLSPDDPSAVKNFVIFDDKIVDILRKYGLLAPMATGAAIGSGLLDVDAEGNRMVY